MKIRLAKLSDYEELINLYNLFVGKKRFSTKNNDSFEKVLDSSNNFVFVAEENNKLVGFTTFSIRLVIRYPKPIAELDELFIIEEYRKHGIGKKLMEAVEEKAKALDCLNMFIESVYDRTAAHEFYESLGYKNEGYHFKKIF